MSEIVLAWLLKDCLVMVFIVDVSSIEQLDDNLAALRCTDFREKGLTEIENIIRGMD